MKYIFILITISLLFSCNQENIDADRFKTGTFEIPEGNNYKKTTIIRKDSLQIEFYNNRIDTLKIIWKNNFSYTLLMVNPKTSLDKDPIYVNITNVTNNDYDFEARIGFSNFTQKGTIFKIAE